jgi:transcriptional regulator with XRE-family HTH domain
MNWKSDPMPPISDRIEGHFEAESPADIVRRSQALVLNPIQSSLALDHTAVSESALTHAHPHRLQLDAYLACALTGLSSEQRCLIDYLSEIIDVACREVEINLYQPAKHTDPNKHANISAAEVFKRDKERVVSSDLLIHLCHFPSTGSGEELSFAYDALVPIILIAPGEQTVSRMITGIPSLKMEIRYANPNDLRNLLEERLWEIRPLVEQRRLAIAAFSQNIVGAKIRELRLEGELTRAELADRVGLTVEGLANIEENIDTVSNPSLTVLRLLATALKTTVTELVNPDYAETIISAIQSILNERGPAVAARFTGMSDRDRKALVRRYLIRVLDIIENGQSSS